MIISRLLGGLGNQMYQYAFGLALSSRLRTELVLDVSEYSRRLSHNGYELQNVFGITNRLASSEDLHAVLGWRAFPLIFHALHARPAAPLRGRFIAEPHYHFAPAMLATPDNAVLHGYWQSEKYFISAEKQVRSAFRFRQALDGKNAGIACCMQDKQSVSVHIRRGDYATNERANRILGTCAPEYYEAAFNYISERTRSPLFFIFSDDMGWTEKNVRPRFPHIYVNVNKGAASWADMQLMSKCRHHIIANSTFSWWAAWLDPNPGKIVIAPKKWFSADGYDTRDLIPETWIRL